MNKTNKIIIGVVVVLVIIGGIWYGVVRKPAEKGTIKIGAILPLTGDAAQWGVEAKNAIELAASEINERRGINGGNVNVVFEDDQLQPALGTQAINKLINLDKIKVIIGAISSSVTLAIAPIAESNKVVLISPASTSHDITNAGDYIFRTISSDIIEGSTMAEFAYDKLEYKKVSVIAVNAAGTKGMADTFVSKFKEYGGQVLAYELIPQGGTDFRTEITKANKANLDAFYIVGFPLETGFVTKQIRELGIRIQLLSAQPAEDPQTREIAGNSAEGLMLTSTTVDITSAGTATKEFVNKYKVKYGHEPGVFSYEAYDAFNLIIHAINIKGYSGEKIKDYLYGVKDYNGVSGNISFDKNGDVVKPIRILKINNGQLVPYDK